MEGKTLNQRELKQLIDAEVMKEDGVVFKCNACSNLSMDKENWLITLSLPKQTHKDFNYISTTCSYCENLPKKDYFR